MRIAPSAKPDPVSPRTSHDSATSVELVAQQRHALAEPDEPEVADRRAARRAAAPSRATERAGDDVGRVHSIEIRTPSPPSSTSTIGPLMPAAIASRIRSEVASEIPGTWLIAARPSDSGIRRLMTVRPASATWTRSARAGPAVAVAAPVVRVGRRRPADRDGRRGHRGSGRPPRPSADPRRRGGGRWSSAVGVRPSGVAAPCVAIGGRRGRRRRAPRVADRPRRHRSRRARATEGCAAARRRRPARSRRSVASRPSVGGSGDRVGRRAGRGSGAARGWPATGTGVGRRPQVPDIERNVSSGPPVPIASDRRPRPPSSGASTSELRSPDIVVISIRRSPAGASRPSPLTVSMPNGPGPASRPATLRSPLVVATTQRPEGPGAKLDVARDGPERAPSASPVAMMSTSPETASMSIRPLTARRVDVARRRPIALIAEQAVRLDVGAGGLDDDRRSPRQRRCRGPGRGRVGGGRGVAVTGRRVSDGAALGQLDGEHRAEVVAAASRMRTVSPSTAAEADLAVAQSDRHEPVGADGVVEAGAGRRARHRVGLPSARIAAAASSALISWRARAWRISSRLRPAARLGGRARRRPRRPRAARSRAPGRAPRRANGPSGS